MKKKLLFFMPFAAMLFLAASCWDDNNEENTPPVIPTKNSEVYFIGPNGARSARSANPNSNQWADKYGVVPAPVTIQEADDVYQYFVDHSADRQGEVSIDYTNFFVQHVWSGTDKYETEDMNHAKHQMVGGEHMDMLCAANEDHVNNFNASLGSIMCMENSSTAHFSYRDSYGDCGKVAGDWSTRRDKYIILQVPGYGIYLGFDYETYKNSGERHEGDGVYTDWIIKITNADAPTEITPANPGIVIPENESGDKMIVGAGEVEFDIHQQEHTDWNEIKTSIHVRDTVNCRVLIPIPAEYQAEPDDFAIRVGDKYEYITKTFEIADKQYDVHFAVGHTEQYIEIVIGTGACAKALKAAREHFGDGLTFEVHTYVKPTVSPANVWEMLMKTTCPQTSIALWAPGAPHWMSVDQDVATNIFGKVSSAYYPEKTIPMKYNYSNK